MKKGLLLLFIALLSTLNLMADSSDVTNEVRFDYEIGGQGIDNRIPITGNINNGNLNLNYKGNDNLYVSVKNKNGVVVHQDYIGSSSQKTINLNGYSTGDYTIKVEDSSGNAAVANFNVKN